MLSPASIPLIRWVIFNVGYDTLDPSTGCPKTASGDSGVSGPKKETGPCAGVSPA